MAPHCSSAGITPYGKITDNIADIIVCIGVLQHLQEPKLAADNLVKAAKKGGVIVAYMGMRATTLLSNISAADTGAGVR
jgi:2-polyprenyl-3-methyl-5-hydroxy-6-metoxy-1,4-benzoquinol methylase